MTSGFKAQISNFHGHATNHTKLYTHRLLWGFCRSSPLLKRKKKIKKEASQDDRLVIPFPYLAFPPNVFYFAWEASKTVMLFKVYLTIPQCLRFYNIEWQGDQPIMRKNCIMKRPSANSMYYFVNKVGTYWIRPAVLTTRSQRSV
jgi:hypothetical protein